MMSNSFMFPVVLALTDIVSLVELVSLTFHLFLLFSVDDPEISRSSTCTVWKVSSLLRVIVAVFFSREEQTSHLSYISTYGSGYWRSSWYFVAYLPFLGHVRDGNINALTSPDVRVLDVVDLACVMP